MASEFDQGLIDNFNSMVERKKAELSTQSEAKLAVFGSHDMDFSEGSFDGDSTEGKTHGYTNPLGFRLGDEDADTSLDAFETAKFSDDGTLKPYLGKIAPTNGSKRSKKWDLHRTSYAKRFGLPSKEYVSQEMLNEEANVQAEHFKNVAREGHVVGTTQYDKPAFYMDGEVVSEKSTTIEMDGKWINIPTIWGGKQLSEDEIKQKLINNEIRPTSVHSNQKDALLAAQTRTESITEVNFEGNTPLDVRKNGVGYFDRDLITARNPATGEILNEVLNTSDNNASYFSKYNRGAWKDAVNNLRAAERELNASEGKGFWDSALKGASSGVDNLQATGYGFAALIADATGNQEFADDMLKEYLAQLDEARANGANLPNVEDVDWSNPTAALSKLGSLIGEAMPSIAMMIGTAGIGGIAAQGAKQGIKYGVKNKVKGWSKDAAAKELAKAKAKGQLAGSYIGANVMETGSIYGDVAVAGERDGRAQAMAFAGGSLAASLEILTPLKLMEKWGIKDVATKEVRKALVKNNIPQMAKQISKEFLKGGSIEGITEGLQFAIEETTQDLIKHGHLPEYSSDEFKSGLLNSVVAGFAPGATLSGGTSLASEVVGQIDGNKKVVNTEASRIANEAKEARDGTVADHDVKSEVALSKSVELAEGLDVEFETQAGTESNLEKAQAYLGELNKAESTPEIEAAKSSLNEAISQYESGDAKVQYQKESTPNQQEYDSETQNIDETFDNLIEKYPNRTAKYEEMRKIQHSYRANQAIKRQKPIDKNAKPGKEAFGTVISTNIQSSLDKIAGLSTKLVDTTISKKHRKRLEAERNNHGLLIESLQGLNKDTITKSMTKNITSTLESFEYAHKKSSEVSVEEISVNIAKQKQADTELKATQKNEESTEADVAEAKLKWLQQRQQLIINRDAAVLDAQNSTDKGSIEEARIKAKGLDDTISAIDAQYNIIKDDTQPSGSTSNDSPLYSLDIDSLGSNEVLGSIDKGSLKGPDKQTFDLRETVTKSLNAIKQTVKGSKTLGQVHNDVLNGKDSHFKGFKAFLQDAKVGKFNADRFNNFVDGLSKKAAAFTEASRLSKENSIPVFIDKKSLKVLRNVPADAKVTEVVNSKGEVTRKNYEGYWWVDSKSDKLVNLVNLEAELGKNTGVMINQVLSTADTRTKDAEQQNRLQQANAEINKLIKKDTPEVKADKDLKGVKAEETTSKKQKEEINIGVVHKKGAFTKLIKRFDEIKAAIKRDEKASKRFGWVSTWYGPVDYTYSGVTHEAQEMPKAFANIARQLEKELGHPEGYFNSALMNIFPKGKGIGKHADDESIYIRDTGTIGSVATISLGGTSEVSIIPNDGTATKVYTIEAGDLYTMPDGDFQVINKHAVGKASASRISMTFRHIPRSQLPKKNKNTNPNEAAAVQTPSVKAKAVIGKYNAKAKTFLGRFKDMFLSLRDTTLRVVDLFALKDNQRTSFFSKNSDEHLTAELITSKLQELGITDTAYIVEVAKHFELFKKTFNEKVLTELEAKDVNGFLALGDPHHMFTKQDGTVPDEVIFSMMLATMHWTAINQNMSNTTPRFAIANLLYGDPKQVSRLTAEQITTFSDTGIFIKSAAKDIGIEIFDILNIKPTKESEQDLLIHLDLERLSPAFKESKLLLKDTMIGNRASMAFGLLALQTANHMYLPNSKKVEGGLLEIVHGQYSADLFDNTQSENLNTNDQGNVQINTVQVQESKKIDNILGIFKQGTDSLKVIKGADTLLQDTFKEPVDELQQKADKSFFDLPSRVRKTIKALQNVKWSGKVAELDLFSNLDSVTLHRIIGIKPVDREHDTDKAAVEAANKEKLKDVEYVEEYIANGNLDFYHKYKAQAQHRLRIVSNTINSQRSKIHRALFFPAGKTSTIKTASDRAVFKLAVGQAFGVGVDKQTLDKSLADFDTIYNNTHTQRLLELFRQRKDMAEAEFSTEVNKAINSLMEDGVADPSVHLLEGIVALTKYDETAEFQTDIGIETDGITNGYAIGLLQFLGGTPQEMKERLARVGVFVDAKDAVNTYETFIKAERLDIYQSLSKMIVDRLKATVKPKTLAAIDILHGKLEDESGKLTSFARNLAKNPLMITNYGAGVAKVIKGIIDSIVPGIYAELASIQTEYNEAVKSGNKAQIKLVTAKVVAMEKALADLTGRKVNLVGLLNKKFKDKGDGLYSFEFDYKLKGSIESSFDKIYADVIKEALDELIGPIQEAREVIVQAVEAQYFAFINAFEKETAGVSNIATKMAIAGMLADKYMPRMSGPWSTNPNELIQLIKFHNTDANAVQIKHKGVYVTNYKKSGKNWNPMNAGENVYIQANSFTPEFTNPGVASAINMVQNMDSVVLGDLLIANPQVVPIFDAVISSVNDAVKNKDLYNVAFKKWGLEHSFLEDTQKQLSSIFKGMPIEEIAEVNELIQTKGHAAIQLNKKLKHAKSNKERSAILKKLALLNVNQVNRSIKEKIAEVASQRAAMEETFGKDWMNVVSQMYLPESLADLEGAVETKVESDASTEVVNDTSEGMLSSIDMDATIELEEVYTTSSLRLNLQNIFDKLGGLHKKAYYSSEDRVSQQTHLQHVIDEIISKAGNLLDETTVTLNTADVKTHGQANIHDTSVDVNFNKYSPISYSEQSAQEVYLHELLHILTRHALLHNSKFKEQIKRIRNDVKNAIEADAKENGTQPYEVFLHKNANGGIIYSTDKAAEIAAAQDQYNYIFGSKTPGNAVLDEFLAYSLTNKFMVGMLSDMPASTVALWSNSKDDTVIEKIIKLFSRILDNLASTLNKKRRPANLEMEIFELTKDIVAVNQSKRDTIGTRLKLDVLGKNVDDANRIVSNFLNSTAKNSVKVGSDEYIKLVDKLTKDGKVNNFLANVLYDTKLIAYFTSSYKDFVDNHPKVQRRLDKAFRGFKPNTLRNLSSLKADLFGGVDQDFVKLLYKSHKEIDAGRRQYKELTKESLTRLFKTYDQMTAADKDSITRVVLKTDISVLISTGAYTADEVVALIADDNKLQTELNKYANRLGVKTNRHYDVQSKELANLMVKGKTNNHNQYLNANNILKTSAKKSTYNVAEGNELNDLDVYISMLALKATTRESKDIFGAVAANEFNADKTHNGIHGLINLHNSFKAKSLEDGFRGNPALMTKGYVSVITDPDVDMQVESASPARRMEMEAEGYEYVGDFHDITGVNNKNYGIYILKNNPELTRTKGIMSATSKKAKGTSLKEILFRDEDNYKLINAKFKRFAQGQENKSNKLDRVNYTMVPVVNEDLEIVDYRINMQHSAVEKHLKQDLAFDEVLPTMFSTVEDKIKSAEINAEAIELLYDYGQANFEAAPQKFVNIMSGAYFDEYFMALPKEARWLIEQRATINKTTKDLEFFVERKLLDTVFGYQDPSVSNLGIFNKSPKARRYAKVIEKLWKEAVSMAVVNIVIKIPIVPVVNFTSNFVTSMMYGVPPNYLIKKWREGITELNTYRTEAKELKLLDIEMLSNPAAKTSKSKTQRRAAIVHSMNTNPVAGLVDAGLFNSITEDINQNEFTYRNKGFNKIKEVGNKVFKGKVFDVANHAYLGEHTAVFKAAMHFTQMSDFIARYALYSYNTQEKGMSKDRAWKQMVETFVNYDQPLNRHLQWTNDMGVVMFIKYWMRIQRAGLNLIKEKPVNVGMLFVGNGLLDMDIETILETNLVTGNFFPTLGGFDKIVEEVLIPPGLQILGGEGF